MRIATIALGIGFVVVVIAFLFDSPDKIEDNVSAARIVTVGLTLSEVIDRTVEPAPPTSTLSLREWTEGDGVRIDVAPDFGEPLALTPNDVDFIDSAYYAWIFFPTESRGSDPTFLVFRAEDDRVIGVSRFDCDFSLAALELGDNTGPPVGSPCQP